MQEKNNYEDFQTRAALYALDALSSAEARAFENDLTLASDEARAEVEEFFAITAQLGLSVDEQTPSSNVRQRLLAQVSNETNGTKPNPTPLPHLDVLAAEGRWVKLFEGGYSKRLFVEPSNGYVTSLLKLEPGARIPDHKHHGNEQCLIVSGEFRINEKVYGPGDFTVAPDGSEHLDLFTETGALLLLVSPPDYELVAARA